MYDGEPQNPHLAVLRSELRQHPPKPGAWPTAPTQAQHLRAVLAARGPATRRDTVSPNLLPPQTRQQPCSVRGALGGGQGFVPALFQPRLWVLEAGAGASRAVPGGHVDTHGEPRWPWESGLALQGQKGRFEGLAHPAKPPAAAVTTAKSPPQHPVPVPWHCPVPSPRSCTRASPPWHWDGPSLARTPLAAGGGKWGTWGDAPHPYLQSWPPHGSRLPFCSRETLQEERESRRSLPLRPPRVLLQHPVFFLGLFPWWGAEGGDFSLSLGHDHVPKQIGAGACGEAHGWHRGAGAAPPQ